MKYCVMLGCQRPQNPDTNQFCQYCGSKLLLRERYRPVQPISRGGFGRTFLAIDEDIPSKPLCVVKQLCLDRPTPQNYAKALQLFQKEAVRLDELGKYSQIPSLLAHFQQNRLFYLVQEFIEGQTLDQEATQHGPYTEKEVIALLQDLLPTLSYIHQQNVIHRDIKPSNIIRRKADNTLVLIDFGIAKVMNHTTALRTGTIIGTAEYMAPEQNRGKVFPCSDLYSLAVVCVRLFTAQSPFDVFDVEHNRWMWRDRLSGHQQVSYSFATILDKMLQDAVSQRYQSAEAVLADLRQVQSFGSSLAKAQTPTQTTQLAPGSLSLLPSEVGVDYRNLRNLLSAHKWQQADEATWVAVRLALGKAPGSYIFSGDLRRVPCTDLQTLDRLWIKYSMGRFGFTAQARIYKAVGEDYGLFCEQVGWRRDNRSDRPEHWHFNYLAPPGHLPSRLGLGGQQWWQHIKILAERLTACRQNG